MKNVFLALALFLSAEIAVAQEPTPEPGVVGELVGPPAEAEVLPPCIAGEDFQIPGWINSADMPDFLVKLLPLVFAFLLGVRGLHSALLWAKDKTATKVDDKAAQILGTVLGLMEKALGIVWQIFAPKAAIMAKAEAIAIKEMDSAKGDGTKGS